MPLGTNKSNSRNAGNSIKDKASIDSREINFSNMTNYHHKPAVQIFTDEEDAEVKQSRQRQRLDDSKSSPHGSQSPSRRKFRPVLKAKSYLN